MPRRIAVELKPFHRDETAPLGLRELVYFYAFLKHLFANAPVYTADI